MINLKHLHLDRLLPVTPAVKSSCRQLRTPLLHTCTIRPLIGSFRALKSCARFPVAAIAPSVIGQEKQSVSETDSGWARGSVEML